MQVEGDAFRLTQLLTNVLNNAARYTPPGGKVWIRGRIEGGHAVVRVRDTGRGIEPELIGRIFDMFVQGRTPLERVGGGLGIGLALARRIAEMHGGSLKRTAQAQPKAPNSRCAFRSCLQQPAPPTSRTPGRRRRRRLACRAACWSWTTTPTPRRRWSYCLSRWDMKRASRMTARRLS